MIQNKSQFNFIQIFHDSGMSTFNFSKYQGLGFKTRSHIVPKSCSTMERVYFHNTKHTTKFQQTIVEVRIYTNSILVDQLYVYSVVMWDRNSVQLKEFVGRNRVSFMTPVLTLSDSSHFDGHERGRVIVPPDLVRFAHIILVASFFAMT